MAGFAHDVLVQALRQDMTLLPAILARVRKGPAPRLTAPIDSAVRFTRPAEVRPDVAYLAEGGWVLCEVQNKIDPKKRRRWPLAAAILHDETKRMGDIVVITASASVARWAHGVVDLRGPTGTSLRLIPVVVHLGLRRAQALLDPDMPALALCAAWAMQHRHGPEAARIVEQAIEVTERLPPPLRDVQWRAIFDVLSDKMLSRLREVTMDPDRITERPAVRKLRLLLEQKGRERGREEGQLANAREALLTVLAERGLTPAARERARIDTCTDVAQLGLWLKRAVTAPSVADVLAATVPAHSPSSGARRPRTPAKTRTA